MKTVDRKRHILRTKDKSYCGVSLKGYSFMVYTPKKGDKIRELLEKRVCKNCLIFYLGERYKKR